MDRLINKTWLLFCGLFFITSLSWGTTPTKTATHIAKQTHSSSKHHPSHRHHSKHQNAHKHHTLTQAEAPLDDSRTDHNTFTKNQKFALQRLASDSLVNYAGNTVRNLRHTSYKLGGNDFDPMRGIYRLDCSAYVDNLLQQVNPAAYSTLAQWSGTFKPTSADYFAFFNRPMNSDWRYWHKIPSVKQLNPGDILVFRYNKHRSGGHVMIVMGKPISDPSAPNVFWINVADSAASGHTDDTRPAHTSGVGIGKLLVKVNPNTQQVDSYAWKAGADWKHNIKFVMGSPKHRNDLS